MTGEDVRLFGSVFVTLFVIMDPPGTIPSSSASPAGGPWPTGAGSRGRRLWCPSR
jgi:hypothetical protein